MMKYRIFFRSVTILLAVSLNAVLFYFFFLFFFPKWRRTKKNCIVYSKSTRNRRLALNVRGNNCRKMALVYHTIFLRGKINTTKFASVNSLYYIVISCWWSRLHWDLFLFPRQHFKHSLLHTFPATLLCVKCELNRSVLVKKTSFTFNYCLCTYKLI